MRRAENKFKHVERNRTIWREKPEQFPGVKERLGFMVNGGGEWYG